MATPHIDLGFVEKQPEKHLLTSPFFPSKVGGRPAWLSLNLPSDADLACGNCGEPTTFLLQVYSPRDSEEAFHRTCFLFICRNTDCCKPNSSDNLKVFRSQLPKINDYYSPDAPKEGEVPVVAMGSLCLVCGNPGRRRCAACSQANYCSKVHQQHHWPQHKLRCKHPDSPDPAPDSSDPGKGVLFPEFEIVNEVEECDWDDDEEDAGPLPKDEAQSTSTKGMQGEALSVSELEKFAARDNANDRQIQKFKMIVSRNSGHADQILRHNIGGKPLWIAADHQAKGSDIPNCHCGAPREFEFQVMPQLLSHLEVDRWGASLDWGVLCVYTCSASCSIGNKYTPEFVWKQDFDE